MNFKLRFLAIWLIGLLLQSCGVKGDPQPEYSLSYPSTLEKYTQPHDKIKKTSKKKNSTSR